jgi:hypothetical protein
MYNVVYLLFVPLPDALASLKAATSFTFNHRNAIGPVPEQHVFIENMCVIIKFGR